MKNNRSYLPESTVFTATLSPSFYVVKYKGNQYIGEDDTWAESLGALVDNLEDAKTFSSIEEAQNAIDEYSSENLLISHELSEPELQDLIDAEIEDYGDEYEEETKKASGLIDEYPAIQIIKDRFEIKPIYAEFRESKNKESSRMKEGFEFDYSGWKKEDIELHKKIDWEARDYKEYVVPGTEYEDSTHFYGDDGLEIVKEIYAKRLRPNPTFPPYYGPVDNTSTKKWTSAMYDGRSKDGYNIHDRRESWEVYRALSEKTSKMREEIILTPEQKESLYKIADRYCTSKPVSGSWDTEAEHELNAICKEMDFGRESAKEIMKRYLGFTDRMFDDGKEIDLSEEEQDLLWDIANKYCTSVPISGSWDTETEHQINTIMNIFGISRKQAIQCMKKYLGWTDEDLIYNHVKLGEAKLREANYKVKDKMKEFKHGDLVSVMSDYNEIIPGYRIIKKVSKDDIPGYFAKSLDDYWEVEKVSGFGKGERSVEWGQKILKESELKESNPVTSDLPEDLDSFLQDIAQAYSRSLTYGDLIHHKYTEEDINDLYEIMTSCEKRDFDEDFIEDVAVPAIERIFFEPEPNPEDYEPTYKGYLKYCKDTNGEPYSKEEWTKITGLTESIEEESYENYSLFIFDDESDYRNFENLRGYTDYSTEDSCYATFHADNDEAALNECKRTPSKKEVAVLCRRYDYDNHEPIYIKYENSKEWRDLRKTPLKENSLEKTYRYSVILQGSEKDLSDYEGVLDRGLACPDVAYEDYYFTFDDATHLRVSFKKAGDAKKFLGDLEGSAWDFSYKTKNFKMDESKKIREADSDYIKIGNRVYPNTSKDFGNTSTERVLADTKRAYDQEQEEKAKAIRRAELEKKAEVILDEIKADWDSKEDKLEVLFNHLVPRSGKAETVAGELVRAMMKILYRDYNDGDIFYDGYGKETCGAAAAFICEKLDDFEGNFIDIVEKDLKEDDYTRALNRISAELVDYIMNNTYLLAEENEEDMYDCDEDYFDDYVQRYSYDPDLSGDLEAYIDHDKIDWSDVADFLSNFLSDLNIDYRNLNQWARDAFTIENLSASELEEVEEEFPNYLDSYLSDLENEYGSVWELDEEEEEDEEDDEEDLKESQSFLAAHKQDVEDFLRFETTLETSPVCGEYLHGSYYFGPTNYGVNAYVREGKIRIDVHSYHPYNIADYHWARCNDFLSHPDEWTIVLAQKIKKKEIVDSFRELVQILKKADTDAKIEPHMMHESSDKGLSVKHVEYVLDNILNWNRNWDFDKRSLKQIAKACKRYDNSYSAEEYLKVIRDNELLDKTTKNSIYRTKESLEESKTENLPYVVVVKDITENTSELDPFFDCLPDILQDERVYPGWVQYEYASPRSFKVGFKNKKAAEEFYKDIDRNLFEVRFYVKINNLNEGVR